MMLSFLFSTVVYFATGYLTFLQWIARCPPRKGTFGNEWGAGWKLHSGWFTPSWVDISSFDDLPRGQSVQVTFWQSVLIWPLIWLVVFIIKPITGLNAMGRSISKYACESVTKQLPSPPLIEKEFMAESNREVEKLLTEEN